MIRVVLIAFIVTFVSACHQNKTLQEQTVFIDLDESKKMNLSDYFQHIEYSLLDVPDSIPLVKVWKFGMNSDKILVSDREF